MSGSRQVRRPSGRINGDLNGVRAIVCRYSGAHSVAGIDRFTESCSIIRGIFGRHRADAQAFKPLFGHGQANQPATVPGHKVDGFGSNFFGGQGQIAFVFAIFVIHNDNHAPARTSSSAVGTSVKGGWGLIWPDFNKPGSVSLADRGAPESSRAAK